MFLGQVCEFARPENELNVKNVSKVAGHLRTVGYAAQVLHPAFAPPLGFLRDATAWVSPRLGCMNLAWETSGEARGEKGR